MKIEAKIMTQDYWLQVMTVAQRKAVMDATGYKQGESVEKRYTRCLAYVFEKCRPAVIEHQRKLMAEINV
jgi:hypothetical protein